MNNNNKMIEKNKFKAEDFVNTQGLNKELLQSQNLRLNTELAKLTIEKLKTDFNKNIILIIIGVVIGYIPNLLNEDKTTEVIELLTKSKLETQQINYNFQTDIQKMRLELISLKKEIDSLKNN
jgi:hypothetical protein